MGKKLSPKTAPTLLLNYIVKCLPHLSGKAYRGAVTAMTMIRVSLGEVKSRYKSENKRQLEIDKLKAELRKERKKKD